MGILSKLFGKLFRGSKTENIRYLSAARVQKGQSHAKIFKVAGVTFNNRQVYLKKLYDIQNKGDKPIHIALKQYQYDNHPAFKVLANGYDIGNLHSEDADIISHNSDVICGIKNFYIGYFEEKNIYYAKITLIVKNKYPDEVLK